MKDKLPKKLEFWLQKENLLRIEGWAKDGLTEAQIAECMEVSYSTFRRWKDRPNCDQLRNVLKYSKEIVDRQVENALLKRALGYDYEEVTSERVPVYDPHTGTIVNYNIEETKRIKKHVPPDATSMIFWLKNRKYLEWRDKHEVENTDAIEKLDRILAQVEQVANDSNSDTE